MCGQVSRVLQQQARIATRTLTVCVSIPMVTLGIPYSFAGLPAPSSEGWKELAQEGTQQPKLALHSIRVVVLKDMNCIVYHI